MDQIKEFLDFDRPHPPPKETGKCKKCGIITDDWTTHYPKEKGYYFLCKACKEKEINFQRKLQKKISIEFQK